jgi:Flp pilus assembly pilin Flp
MAKYIILLAVIAVAVVLTMQLFGPKIGNTFSTIASCLGCGTNLPQATQGVIDPATEPPVATEPPLSASESSASKSNAMTTEPRPSSTPG